MTHYVIGIDPQEEAIGVAVIRTHRGAYRLLDWSQIKKGYNQAKQALQIAQGHFDFHFDEILLAIEGQFYHRKNNNPQTFMKLIEARRDYECAALQLGIDTIIVPPKTWQSKMLGKGLRDQLKKTAQLVFMSRFEFDVGKRQVSEHCVDAALIAAYVIESGKLGKG